ncbi:MAG TPA: Zn-ribbon domain-containing OB-fold protein [Alphaproteobacteria bacterium]|nr:Zn-ribbon domain-containing OB-fold protein [Alphaproteobacteria bacterium]
MPPSTDAADTQGLLPVVPFLKIPDGGDPYLEGSRCKHCKAVFLGERSTCSSCGARDQMETIRLSSRGELYVYSIVHRSFPGIEVPYVSAVVDLEGGGTVKGNLINIDPEPEKIEMGMPVEVVFKKAPRKDGEGNEYLTYYFQPRT